LPNEAFNTIKQLTRVFYSLRFGRQEIGNTKNKKNGVNGVQNLEPLLAKPTRKPEMVG